MKKVSILLLLTFSILGCQSEQCTCTTYLNGTEYSVFTTDINCDPSYYSYEVGDDFWEDICE
jgi:hypothetical protein